MFSSNKTNYKKLTVILLLSTTSTLFTMGHSQSRQPPQEAIDICKYKSSKESCSITTLKGETLEGTCQDTPDGKYFVCMPENMPKHRRVEK